MGTTIVFFIFAIMAVAAAWGVVTSKNIVHSAFFLALTFAGVAVLYVLLNADFLAAVQLLVYMGAVNIMVIFAVMLTLRGDVKQSSLETKKWGLGALGAALVFIMIALVILTHADWRIPAEAWSGQGSALAISELMLKSYMIPFEAAAILLTLALVGAVILAKGVKESK